MTATLTRQPNTTVDGVGAPAIWPAAPPARTRSLGAPALLVEQVTKRFNVDRKKPPVSAIVDVSLSLERGAIHGILGANGITLEYPIMRHMTNLESVITYEGTEEVHTLVIGEQLTGLKAFT